MQTAASGQSLHAREVGPYRVRVLNLELEGGAEGPPTASPGSPTSPVDAARAFQPTFSDISGSTEVEFELDGMEEAKIVRWHGNRALGVLAICLGLLRTHSMH